MAQGYAGSATQVEAPREQTINERLNKVADSLQYQCERIESVLSRVNGTPPLVNKAPDKLAQIKPTHSMTNVTEMLEAINTRLAELSVGVERIA